MTSPINYFECTCYDDKFSFEVLFPYFLNLVLRINISLLPIVFLKQEINSLTLNVPRACENITLIYVNINSKVDDSLDAIGYIS